MGSGVVQEDEAAQVSRQEETFLSSFPIGSWQSPSTSWSDNMLGQEKQHSIKELLTPHGKFTLKYFI